MISICHASSASEHSDGARSLDVEHVLLNENQEMKVKGTVIFTYQW